ncbi:MAG: DUF3098 domain-containing protein [Calditrichaeota bacterium]|nr:MAG: DUF3098 domain-containing protein [Calditrichota bacterium]MBL1205690.1 DUF3098 domain-containing protein [Calditrichota bacterium]NOG45518.1 DUF3098 domain-containing protein [Calditrichota bacterium]
MAKTAKTQAPVQSFTFGKRNLYILTAGIITIIIGFVLMAQPPVNGFLSRTLAPIILVIAYLVIIPISILAKNKE